MSPKSRDFEGDDTSGATETDPLGRGSAQEAAPGTVPRFQLTVLDGPAAGHSFRSRAPRASIGSHQSNDLVIDDAGVSRFHAELVIDGNEVRIRDLGSRNGTLIDGVLVLEACLRPGSLLRMGHTALRFELDAERLEVPLSQRTEFGTLVGTSAIMRATFALLEHAAASDATVLLTGETGTGKDLAAESIHRESRRRERPFVVVDCSALQENLLESELFGHEKGAFTGAAARRIGAFEEASSGTILLDEIGELPADLQPKLLRVLEQRQIRRVGGNAYLPVDVRVVAATNRDLRAEVNAGRFRSDLYFRLAVVHIQLPPLRSRPEDAPLLAERLLTSLGAEPEQIRELLGEGVLAAIRRAAWPGNVRELRNYLERCLVFRRALPTAEADTSAAPPAVDLGVGLIEGRQRAVAAYERAYLEALLVEHGARMQEAARAAGIDRVYLYKLLRRHGLHRRR